MRTPPRSPWPPMGHAPIFLGHRVDASSTGSSGAAGARTGHGPEREVGSVWLGTPTPVIISDPAQAALITARAALVVDALLATGVAVAAGQPARYDDPDPRDEEALRAYVAEHDGLPGLARHLASAGERLLAACTPYHEEYGTLHRRNRPPLVRATMRERGDIVIDGMHSWPGLMTGLGWLLTASRSRTVAPRAHPTELAGNHGCPRLARADAAEHLVHRRASLRCGSAAYTAVNLSANAC